MEDRPVTLTLPFRDLADLFKWADSQAVDSPQLQVSFAPWVEFNEAPSRSLDGKYGAAEGANPEWSYLEYYRAGLEIWVRFCKDVIITTTKQRLAMGNQFGSGSPYPHLIDSIPAGTRLIGGLKLVDYFPGARPFDASSYDFSASEPWQLIAEDAQRIVAQTQMDWVALEAESAIAPFRDGQATINYDRLVQSLRPLADTSNEFLLYPFQLSYPNEAFPTRTEETKRLVEALIKGLPRCKFRTLYSSYPGWQQHPLVEPYREAMISLVGLDKLCENLYVTPSGQMVGGKPCYTPAQALAEMQLALPCGNMSIVWPGSRYWIRVGEIFESLICGAPPAARAGASVQAYSPPDPLEDRAD